MKRTRILFTAILLFAFASYASDFLFIPGQSGPGHGKRVVLLTGDEEYRSEEGLPQIAKILAQRHGYDCTVLFAIDPATGAIDPNTKTNLPGADALDSADVIVMLLRFREWPDPQMNHFADAYLAGKPIIALRTSTHAFNYGAESRSSYSKYSWNSKIWPGGFGKQVLGETWVAHHGAHKKEATRGIIEKSSADDPLLRGVTDIFGNTDVYAASPPSDVKVLVRGQVLAGMNPTDPPVEGPKNNPMQPVVWTRLYKNEAGNTNKIFCTTMGAATDLLNEGLRRLLVNAVYWGAGLEVPARADVALVGDYQPSMYGFDGAKKGVKPADLESKAQSPKSKADREKSQLELKPGDHVAIIGNTLADRFQHSGWLESFVYAKYPKHDLVFRNLALAGDEVAFRHRPDSFGSPDDWLRKVQADVVFAFFGFNESFHGPEGLPKFRADLQEFITATAKQNYSGKGPPKLVLFSPIPNEKLPNPDFPDPTANNANIQLYAEAMRQVAEANGIPFVDLFAASQQLYADAAARGQSLTFNGLQLTDTGDKFLADAIFRGLFGEPLTPTIVPSDDERSDAAEKYLLKLRSAVNEKNEQWHARYRTVDGNNVYGGRSALAYAPEKGGFISDRQAEAPYVSNFKVMQEEMSQRDILTANRDKRVWAVAQGGDLAVDDSNLPPVTKVKSNLPGPNPDQSFPFLGGEEAIAKMKVHAGMKVNLFASEEQFPELAKPVQMAWDTKGRLWVAVWPNYPERTPDSKIGDSLLVLEDTDGDGKADKCTHFMDGLNAPTGFQFYKDGVLLVQAPDVWFIRDTDGDGKADWKERVLMGLSSADSHHTANSLCLDPGGAVYLSDGVFHRTQVETATGVVRNNDAAIYRFEPRTGKFETYVSYDFANPHGRVFDYWGNDLITDGTGNNTYFAPAFSGHIDYPEKHRHMNEFWERPSRPCPATAMLSSRHFPAEFQGNFLNCNVIGFQGIYRVKVSEQGSGLHGETLPDLISSSDPNFRPVAVNLGPDGAIYFADWQNPIIGHMQHHLRDPNRDHAHGRIYRITYTGRPLLKPPRIDGQPIQALLELLKEPEDLTRQLAKVELSKRDTGQVMGALKSWMVALNPSDPAYQHHLLEALWVHQWLNVVNTDLLKRLLNSPEPRSRAAAGRVLCYWRDSIPEALSLLKPLATDPNPRVRLEAVRAASFFRTAEAADLALLSLKQPTDYYLEYTLKETLRQLEPWWRKALAAGQSVLSDNPAGRELLLQTITTPELMKLPPSPMVWETLLTRADAMDADRMAALGKLAESRQTNLVAVLLMEMDASVGGSNGRASSENEPQKVATLARLLPSQFPDKLKENRGRLVEFTSSRHSSELRQNAWAAIVLADGSFEPGWDVAARSPVSLADFLGGIPLLTDPEFRAKAYDRVKPLVESKSSAPPNAEVRRAAIRALVSMNHEPTAVFDALTTLLVAGQQVPAAAEGIRIIPRSKWPRDQAGRAAGALVAWAKTIPAVERTEPDYCQIIQLAGDLAGLLPPQSAAGLRNDLRGLRVQMFVVRTVREQMRYDTPRLVVEAGKPFEILFQNADFMPHNLVIVKPNTREKVGTAAALMKPDDLDHHGRAYVPMSADILAATKMLREGQRESLKLTAPNDEGEHEYFCTFPGHYQVMWGRLIVTSDVEAYLKANPEAPLPTPAPAALLDEPPHSHSH
jgi:glucose/arabinose dehydrogenase/azurin